MAIETHSLRKAYGNFSVDIDVTIRDGETLVFAGPSGCGKTTALKMIAGLVPPDSGSILVDGYDVCDVPSWKRGIGVVFQDLALFPHLSVGGNVAYGPFVRGVPKRERGRIVEDCLKTARLEGYAKRRVDTLSGGERQRTAIARALAAAPKALLMDEPFSSLDAPLRKELRADFRRLRASSDYPCLFVTHDREEAAELADRIAIMDGGRIVEIGTPRELFFSPKTAFSARFLGAGTVMDAELLGSTHGKQRARCAVGIIEIPLDQKQTRQGIGPEGSRKSVLVPRDAVRLVPSGTADARCEALVRSTTFSGEHETILVELPDGTHLTVDAPPRTPLPARDAKVGLRIDETLLRLVEG